MDCEKKIFAWPANLTNGLDEICHRCAVCKPTINGYYLDYLGKYVLECEHREACVELNRRLVEKYESK